MTRPIDQIREILAQSDAKLFTPILPGHASVYVLAADREAAELALSEASGADLDELISVHPLTPSLLSN